MRYSEEVVAARSRRLPSADRRREILHASARLFVERGFEAVTVGDVAAALGISRPAVYSYFPSTGAVLDALLQERLQDLLARLDPLLRRDQAADTDLIGTVFRFLLGERKTLALLHSGGGPTFQARRFAFLRELGARLPLNREMPLGRDPALLLIVTTLLDGLAFRATADPQVDPEALARALTAFAHGGLRPWPEPDGHG